MSEYLSTPIETWEVVPTHDLKEHVNLAQCWCKPRVENCENGSQIVVHNSADGREFYEQDAAGH